MSITIVGYVIAFVLGALLGNDGVRNKVVNYVVAPKPKNRRKRIVEKIPEHYDKEDYEPLVEMDDEPKDSSKDKVELVWIQVPRSSLVAQHTAPKQPAKKVARQNTERGEKL